MNGRLRFCRNLNYIGRELEEYLKVLKSFMKIRMESWSIRQRTCIKKSLRRLTRKRRKIDVDNISFR